MLLRADEDNDDVIESYSLYYIFSVFPSFVYYYLTFLLKTFDTLLTSRPCYKVMTIRHSHISLHPSYRLLCGYIFVNM